MVTNEERIASHLQGAAAIRRWAAENIPLTESALGYDLFIKLGSDFLSGTPLDMKSVCRELPHPHKLVRQQLSKLVQAGFLVQQDSKPVQLLPTPRFSALLDAYVQESDRVFALRKSLRGQQLAITGAGDELQDLVERLYDHFHDLGWLYLHNFGSVCFLMTSLVCKVLRLHGYRAEAVSGHLEIVRASDQYVFKLGAEGGAKPGQIPGHAFCVLEDSLIVDFGLGSIRRAYHRDFPWGLACAYRPQAPILGGMVLGNGDTVTWRNDWQYPESAQEFAKFELLSDQLAARYPQAFGTEKPRQPRLGTAHDSSAMPLDGVPSDFSSLEAAVMKGAAPAVKSLLRSTFQQGR